MCSTVKSRRRCRLRVKPANPSVERTLPLQQKPEISLSIDHIIGLGEHGWQEGWTGRLRSLEVGSELDLLNWQVGGDFVLL